MRVIPTPVSEPGGILMFTINDPIIPQLGCTVDELLEDCMQNRIEAFARLSQLPSGLQQMIRNELDLAYESDGGMAGRYAIRQDRKRRGLYAHDMNTIMLACTDLKPLRQYWRAF